MSKAVEVRGITVRFRLQLSWIVPLAVSSLFVSGWAAFDRVRPGYEYEFPRDYFEHPEFGVEWWYYTGNLATRDGRPFGYELTFFRVGVEMDQEPKTAWDLDQVYLAHFAVTDIGAGRMHRSERVNRRGPGLAGASLAQSTIWNGNWSVEYDLDTPDRPTQRLRAVHEGVTVDLSMQPAKDAVIHGRDGISRKGGAEGQASHYVSFTRLVTRGMIEVDGMRFEVDGVSWMDHEFFTESLASDLVGWDWFSIQLDDGTDLMLYGLRSANGGYSTYSSGTFVDTFGRSLTLDSRDVRLVPGRTWRSRETDADYPVEWRVVVESLGLRLDVMPRLDSQEIISESGYTPAYWEGAVQYSGVRAGTPVRGSGYLEMTGYAEPFSMPSRGRTPDRRPH